MCSGRHLPLVSQMLPVSVAKALNASSMLFLPIPQTGLWFTKSLMKVSISTDFYYSPQSVKFDLSTSSSMFLTSFYVGQQPIALIRFGSSFKGTVPFNLRVFVVFSSLDLIMEQQKKSFMSWKICPSLPPSIRLIKGSMPSPPYAIAYSIGFTSILHILTERSSPPQVNKYRPSAEHAKSAISFGWAIKPIVLLGLPSRGILIRPMTFFFVEQTMYFSS